jgi:hypothetical protein
MTIISRKAAAPVSWPGQGAAITVLSAPLLLLSSTVWILRDRRVWPWDQAWYGQVSIELWQTHVQGTGAWLDGTKNWPAQAISGGLSPKAWIMALHHLTGSIETALLFMNLLLAAGMIALGYCVTRSLGIGTIPMLAGVVASTGSQIFIGLTHQYLVELMQSLTIAAFMLVAVGAEGRSATRTLSWGILIARPHVRLR